MRSRDELCLKVPVVGLISLRPPDSGLRILELLDLAKDFKAPYMGFTHGLALKEWNAMIAHVVAAS